MTISEYKNKKDKLKKSIKDLSSKIETFKAELKKLNDKFEEEYYECSCDSGYYLTKSGIIEFKSKSGKRRHDAIKKSDLYIVKVRNIESKCVYQDWINSGGNEYQIVYIEKTYKMCPKCFKLTEVSREIVHWFPTVYDRDDNSMDTEMQRLSITYKNEINIFDKNNKEVSLKIYF